MSQTSRCCWGTTCLFAILAAHEAHAQIVTLDTSVANAQNTVAIRGKVSPTAVRITELSAGLPPDFLSQSAALMIDNPRRNLDPAFGAIELEMRRDSDVFIAVIFADQTSTEEWAKDLLLPDDLPDHGWVLVGDAPLAWPTGSKETLRRLYWRAAKQGEVFNLRTNRNLSPIVIVPQADSLAPLIDRGKNKFSDELAFELVRAKAWHLLCQENFDQLEQTAAELRAQREMLPAGIPTLRAFYGGICGDFARSDDSWKRYNVVMEHWRQAKPKSATPLIAWGQATHGHATRNTYFGNRNRRSGDSKIEFDVGMQRARTLLAEAEQLDKGDPELYRAWITMAIDLGWTLDRVREILRDSAAADPSYLSTFVQVPRYCFRHRPGNGAAVSAELALESIELTKSAWGKFVYWYILNEARRYLDDDTMFQPSNYSWAIAREGFQDGASRIELSPRRKHEFCHYACLAGDRETAHEAFTKLPPVDPADFNNVWADQEYFESWQAWSRPDYLTGDQQRIAIGGVYFYDGVAWSPDDQQIITVDRGNRVCVWDTVTGTRKQVIDGLQHIATAFAVSPDGRFAATGDYYKTVRLWNLTNGQCQRLGYLGAVVSRVEFSPDGRSLATAGQDGSIVFWDVSTGQRRDELKKAHERRIQGLDFTPNGKQLISTAEDKQVKFWNLESQLAEKTLPTQKGVIRRSRLSLDGKWLALASDVSTRLWSTADGKLIGDLEGETKYVNELAFSPDGDKLACVSGVRGKDVPYQVIVWDVASRKRLHTHQGHKMPISGIAFSHDGQWVATSSHDMSVRVWQVSQ